jgi:hypothetical protein
MKRLWLAIGNNKWTLLIIVVAMSGLLGYLGTMKGLLGYQELWKDFA